MENLKQEIQELKSQVSRLEKRLITNQSSNDFITSKDVMKWLKISLATVHRWKDKGVIVGYMIGGKLFFKRSEITATLEASVN